MLDLQAYVTVQDPILQILGPSSVMATCQDELIHVDSGKGKATDILPSLPSQGPLCRLFLLTINLMGPEGHWPWVF